LSNADLTQAGKVVDRTDLVAVSPWNSSGIEDSPIFDRFPKIADCTLRDGEQQPGVVFRRAEKVLIARLLDEIGVDDIEAGTPAVSSEDREAIAEIAAMGLNAQVTALARNTKDDVDLVASCGATGVRLSFPISDRQREAKLGISEDEYVRRALDVAEYAKGRGLLVIFSPFDTTRCNPHLLESLLRRFAEERTVDRVRLVDTVGGATPQSIQYLVRLMSESGEGIAIEAHCHDDFGLATANTLAAAIAGAEYLSVTVNGLGERAGNTPLEEVAAALALLWGAGSAINLEGLTRLSSEVSRLSGVRSSPHKAVVGENAFRHETGMVVAGVLKDPFTAEPYAPELVGQRRTIVVGKKSGRASVEHKLAELDLSVAADRIDDVVQAVKDLSLERKRALTDREVSGIARTAGGRHARG